MRSKLGVLHSSLQESWQKKQKIATCCKSYNYIHYFVKINFLKTKHFSKMKVIFPYICPLLS